MDYGNSFDLHDISFIYQDSSMLPSSVHDLRADGDIRYTILSSNSSQQKTEQELGFGFASAFEEVAVQPPKV